MTLREFISYSSGWIEERLNRALDWRKLQCGLGNVWTGLWCCKRARTVEHFRADFWDASEAQFGSDCSARLGHFYYFIGCFPKKSNHILERVCPILLLQSGSGQKSSQFSASFGLVFGRASTPVQVLPSSFQIQLKLSSRIH